MEKTSVNIPFPELRNSLWLKQILNQSVLSQSMNENQKAYSESIFKTVSPNLDKFSGNPYKITSKIFSYFTKKPIQNFEKQIEEDLNTSGFKYAQVREKRKIILLFGGASKEREDILEDIFNAQLTQGDKSLELIPNQSGEHWILDIKVLDHDLKEEYDSNAFEELFMKVHEILQGGGEVQSVLIICNAGDCKCHFEKLLTDIISYFGQDIINRTLFINSRHVKEEFDNSKIEENRLNLLNEKFKGLTIIHKMHGIKFSEDEISSSKEETEKREPYKWSDLKAVITQQCLMLIHYLNQTNKQGLNHEQLGNIQKSQVLEQVTIAYRKQKLIIYIYQIH